MLFVISLVFSTYLHFIPGAGLVETSDLYFLLFFRKSTNVIGKSQIGNTSAAYANLSIMAFQKIRHNTFEKNVEESVGESRRNKLTPTVVLNHSPVLPFI